jgi:hypothetical protein
MMSEPDYLAARTGSRVTPTFSGGAESWTWTHDDTVMTLGTGEQPSASKGVAIAFGAGPNSADRDALPRIAMVWLDDHLDDAPSTGGLWNRPLIDVTAGLPSGGTRPWDGGLVAAARRPPSARGRPAPPG